MATLLQVGVTCADVSASYEADSGLVMSAEDLMHWPAKTT